VGPPESLAPGERTSSSSSEWAWWCRCVAAHQRAPRCTQRRPSRAITNWTAPPGPVRFVAEVAVVDAGAEERPHACREARRPPRPRGSIPSRRTPRRPAWRRAKGRSLPHSIRSGRAPRGLRRRGGNGRESGKRTNGESTLTARGLLIDRNAELTEQAVEVVVAVSTRWRYAPFCRSGLTATRVEKRCWSLFAMCLMCAGVCLGRLAPPPAFAGQAVARQSRLPRVARRRAQEAEARISFSARRRCSSSPLRAGRRTLACSPW